jgi:hypothetical protein
MATSTPAELAELRPAARALGWGLLDLAVVLVLVGGLLLPLAGARAVTGDPVLLNEVLVSHTGSPDGTEFVELFGMPGAPLGGLSLVSVDGDNSTAGRIDVRVDFPAGATLGGNGFFLVGGSGLVASYGVTPDLVVAADTFPNGSQTLALVETAGLGAVMSSVTGAEVVRDAVGLTDGGPSDRWFFGAPVIGPDDGFLPGGARRTVDGADTDTAGDWVFADDQLGPANTPTPATPYDAPPTATCGPSLATTQGVADSAPVSAADPDGMVMAFTLNVVPDPGTVTLGTVTPASAPGAPGTTSVEVTATTPSGSYAATVTAWTDASPPQQASCAVSVTVAPAPDPEPEPDPEPPTPSVAGLVAMLDAGLASGDVHGAKASLFVERLARVEAFLAAGQTSAAAAQLQAFANQVAGMSPKWVSPATAADLAAAADAVAESLSSS